jgi:hypothetical protein
MDDSNKEGKKEQGTLPNTQIKKTQDVLSLNQPQRKERRGRQ